MYRYAAGVSNFAALVTAPSSNAVFLFAGGWWFAGVRTLRWRIRGGRIGFPSPSLYGCPSAL